MLFAEKHVLEPIDKVYFRWKKIEETTTQYIPDINLELANFHKASQGFVFKDCFIIEESGLNSYALFLIFEKNVRDERPICCPTCRSINVQGNSYPILNIRSWECENTLCPDRSKYNRGKRYAFASTMRQQQMYEYENQIPVSSISKWRLDCLKIENRSDIFKMALLHYSYWGDTIYFYATNTTDSEFYGRKIISQGIPDTTVDQLKHFKDSAFFHRYLYKKPKNKQVQYQNVDLGNHTYFINCDCYTALQTIDDNTFDAAVTSPPTIMQSLTPHGLISIVTFTICIILLVKFTERLNPAEFIFSIFLITLTMKII